MTTAATTGTAAAADGARALAARGRLRAAINSANPVLFKADAATGEPGGVAVDLATELARRLGVGIDLLVLPSAKVCVAAVGEGEADFGFFAIDPARGDTLHFTPPYVLMEGVYVVRADSAIVSNAQVDQPGRRVAVGAGSAYALHLARELRHARVVDAPGSGKAVDVFLRDGLDAAAGVRQQMRADAERHGGLRMLDGRFMAIYQAMATARNRGAAVAACLDAYVEDVKRAGFVADALERHGVQGAAVAPAGYPRD
ncbi:transporter substrate-binding domain-containing protein [Bordetella genomosp. 11]|uniref:ABC transporter substrate-binding protein n=1 Tax=Bordetella genomosp. 11 TaxID=1416808 RepID=A0A261UYK5_9BORD|nr:transporter substrate-binding domain-containing protein [Bordetella genomosp. 11]OZI66964.1 ABC transporter substrate-binding protein [Bordetella genomosp. 11]